MLRLFRAGTCKEAGGKAWLDMPWSHLQSETDGPQHRWSPTQVFGNASTAMDVSRKRGRNMLPGERLGPLY